MHVSGLMIVTFFLSFMAPAEIESPVVRALDVLKLLEVHYKEALADYLIQHQEPQEALKVLADLQNGQHPVSLLLGDMESFPVPEKAVFDPTKTTRFSEEMAWKGRISDNIYVRARAYLIPSPVKEVETFYKQRFPSFKLGKPYKVYKEEPWMAVYNFLFRRPAAGWELQRRLPDNPTDGMMMTLSEIRISDPEMVEMVNDEAPVALGNEYSVLVVLNLRPVRR